MASFSSEATLMEHLGVTFAKDLIYLQNQQKTKQIETGRDFN